MYTRGHSAPLLRVDPATYTTLSPRHAQRETSLLNVTMLRPTFQRKDMTTHGNQAHSNTNVV